MKFLAITYPMSSVINTIFVVLFNIDFIVIYTKMKGQNHKAKTPREYIEALGEPRRSQIKKIHNFIKKTVPNLKPYIQSGMIGYGKYHYKYKSGREGDWFTIGLASNKNYISIYISAIDAEGGYLPERHKDKLPKADIGKSCIRYKKYDDIEYEELEKLMKLAEKEVSGQLTEK